MDPFSQRNDHALPPLLFHAAPRDLRAASMHVRRNPANVRMQREIEEMRAELIYLREENKRIKSEVRELSPRSRQKACEILRDAAACAVPAVSVSRCETHPLCAITFIP
eukprot:2493230-Pleurochrysis_carterae.AAC.1